ncbi:MAG: hypothetical protein Q8Q87_02605 [Candidatus Omnitrophota bacterium]|nr:hypothetical protein [Candidatus Omnitrophota bacterium]
MIRNVMLGEELVITTINKVGLLADISVMLANEGINVEAAVGYEIGRMAKLMLVTNANLKIVDQLKKKRYKSVKEAEVLLIEIENKPGALKVVTTELKANKIDLKHLYVTTSAGGWSRMVVQTSDNETAMAVLNKFAETAAK